MERSIQVFKFGGASVRDAEGFRNVAGIIAQQTNTPLVVVVSATGKTTNALEVLVAAHEQQRDDTQEIFTKIRDAHFAMLAGLFEPGHPVYDEVNDAFVEIDWMLEEAPHADYDFSYDQIVPVGELVSSIILSHLLREKGLGVQWLDARDLVRTDDTFRDARIQWERTEQQIRSRVLPVLQDGQVAITQGFIGATDDNRSTTLGREGSDYSAAILAYCLNAASMSIWKDVPGILTGDPAVFDNVQLLSRLSFREAIEMTYYGAKVIHPKTIQPLQNKAIPLHVKSFIEPKGEGTLITAANDEVYPPIIVLEKDQALVHISTRDFSFIAVDHLAHIFGLLDAHRIKVNLMRNSAVSFSVCVQHQVDRLPRLIRALEQDFNLVVDRDLELITVRHFHEEQLASLTAGKVVLFEERFRQTVQLVVKDAPIVSRKGE